MIKTQHHTHATTLILRPNRSASWRHTKWLMAALAFVVLSIALAWSLVGAWVILPFAGLEVGLLAILMYRVSWSTYQQQVIHMDKDLITVTCGVKRPRLLATFKRQHTHLSVCEPQPGNDKTRLMLADDTLCVEIGDFLTQSDREQTRHHLRSEGLMICSDQWWKA